MTYDLYRILSLLVYLPLYATAFVGVGLVLRLRRTYPRACWYAVGAGAALFVNWAAAGMLSLKAEQIENWAGSNGVNLLVVYLAFNGLLSILQTLATMLLIAAVVTGRRPEP